MERPARGSGWSTAPIPGDREMSLSSREDITGLEREKERESRQQCKVKFPAMIRVENSVGYIHSL